MELQGRMWILDDDDINTDVIYPGKYTYEMLSPEEMATHALEDHDPSFAKNVGKGDIIIAGRNFGCGSSREQAVTCLKHAGVAAVVAASFARLYYRNAINQALYVIECPKAAQYARGNRESLENETAVLDPEKGSLAIGDRTFTFTPMSGKALEIFEAGGLAAYTKQKLAG
ncbi:MAG TPA: 3-isopropylmalate dehydratase [Patescibacteria group bacterium]|nr:3-isopropylmalate dehydratase [Patescibacteria group bacterium]